MNPLTYNAHRLLTRWIDLLLERSAHGLQDASQLTGILLISNFLWAAGLPWILLKTENLQLPPPKAYILSCQQRSSIPPLMLTLLCDVFAHTFELKNRWFLLFAIIAASQILTAFYAFVLRHRPSDVPIRLESGLAI